MLAPRSAKALQEKVLLKLHGIRKLLGSLSFGGTLFWIIAELSSLKKALLIAVVDRLWNYALLDLVECYLEEIHKFDHSIAFPSLRRKASVRDSCPVEKKLGLLRGVCTKRDLGKESANER
ncbi:hypothetical protein Tco_0680118 [Tanacetum coccineum]|uniref:Uncharacterized protein n=1 Tax=Tanacetum coccineum TaxID=301880 RepID=A0ABQ4XJN4_9ASTR